MLDSGYFSITLQRGLPDAFSTRHLKWDQGFLIFLRRSFHTTVMEQWTGKDWAFTHKASVVMSFRALLLLTVASL